MQMAEVAPAPAVGSRVLLRPASPQNAKDAEVPHWQMPDLVVETARRPSTRVHKGTSVIMPDAGPDFMKGIVSGLPVLLQIRPRWHLGYSMAVDGVSLKTLYRQVAEAGPCLLVVEDSVGCIFGAFMSEGIRPGHQCFGSHECFLFRYPRSAGAWRTEVYGWAAPAGSLTAASEAEQLLQGAHWANYAEALQKCQAWAVHSTSALAFCDDTGIVLGLDGPALFVDQHLLRGVSWPSRAFGSPSLAATDSAGPDFVVRNLEVWHWDEAC